MKKNQVENIFAMMPSGADPVEWLEALIGEAGVKGEVVSLTAKPRKASPIVAFSIISYCAYIRAYLIDKGGYAYEKDLRRALTAHFGPGLTAADLTLVGKGWRAKHKWQQYLASAGSQMDKFKVVKKWRYKGRWYRVWLGPESPAQIREAVLRFPKFKKRRRKRKYPRLHQPARRDVIAG
jgi:hypothetical protein